VDEPFFFFSFFLIKAGEGKKAHGGGTYQKLYTNMTWLNGIFKAKNLGII
jgi:hypothetical protein